MLKLISRRAVRLKCPRHPRQQYDSEGALPASCDACRAIFNVRMSSERLHYVERVAEQTIARTRLAKEARRGE